MRGLVVHQDARYIRNRELRIGLIIRATSCTLHELRIEINHSCIKMHATYEIVNYASGLIIRATSCTLHTKPPDKKDRTLAFTHKVRSL